MRPAVTYQVRVLEHGAWRDWCGFACLADALDAMDAANKWNPLPGREWQVLRKHRGYQPLLSPEAGLSSRPALCLYRGGRK